MSTNIRRFSWGVLIPAVLLMASCVGRGTPTAVPTPVPTPNIDATIAAGIEATAQARPTPTPSPFPTASPTPSPTPTLTPSPTPSPTVTPTPTATLTPSLAGVLPKVRSSVVQVISGAVQISGIAIEPFSLILTASQPLSVAPKVDIVTEDGQTFIGWVIGRDDTQNLNLIRVIDGSIPGIPLADSSALGPGDKLLALGYPKSQSGQLSAVETVITSDRRDLGSGMRLLELDAQFKIGTSGGPLVNNNGELVALAVEARFVQSLGFIVTQENFALATEFIRDALSRLENGVIQLEPRPSPTANPLIPPPLPAIYQGSITLKGAPPPEGTLLYARVIHPDIGDLWLPTRSDSGGNYVLALGVVNSRYLNSEVEFYMEGLKAEIQELNLELDVLRYQQVSGKLNRELDLVFQ